ncbi:alpha-L-Rha alpha-1,3-L-rhamnosyltransferase [Companilactobacillus sp. RD055328]|uniref:glycosyltransferase family 2 protein n=1 Tax=Companilactobacillus sp. RD055328 TaxID=2916634 RepID=UPI001FC7EF08|nr:glycosyltransferase family 2 protein [Companilactobacillus sp. RD055328]GKQ43158.1 alpha-L-Rha alpha-1,3-L-rhamnosyltransferase [Companilactobacillus sp. RD055328]
MISVCIATYNGSKTITRQLESILNQLDENDEVIIVDDKSIDETVEILESIKNKSSISISVIVNETNIGPIKSFEKAIKKANGEYLFFSDQDDIWLENKITQVMNEFNKNADLVIHDGIVVDGDLKIIDNSWNHYNKNKLDQSLIGNIISNGYTGAMMAISLKLAKLVIPFPDSIPMHDQWIFDVAKIEKLKITTISEPLMKYVRHGGNVTGMKKRSKFIMFKDRINLVKELLQYRRKN